MNHITYMFYKKKNQIRTIWTFSSGYIRNVATFDDDFDAWHGEVLKIEGAATKLILNILSFWSWT